MFLFRQFTEEPLLCCEIHLTLFYSYNVEDLSTLNLCQCVLLSVNLKGFKFIFAKHLSCHLNNKYTI